MHQVWNVPFQSALVLTGAWVAAIAGYIGILTLSALFGRRSDIRVSSSSRRFAILIPAHDEEALIGRLLDSLRRVEYPARLWDIFVVADNCADATAAIARSLGAKVYERTDTAHRAKGFALEWLFGQLRADDIFQSYDAYVVLDADSVVEINLLQSLDNHLAAGSRVLQVYYTVLNAGASPLAMLRFAALSGLHYVRPLGRAAMSLSCGLKGNGMCFTRDILERFGWTWFTLAEDVEFHLALVHEGIRVDFVPETCVRADMPVTFAQAASQNERWERGRLQLVQRRVREVMLEGARLRSPMRIDAALEQLIPPLSVPVAVGAACVFASLLTRARLALVLSSLGFIALISHLVIGLALVRAPRQAYGALASAPAYVAWKVALYGRALLNRRSADPAWVRTERPPAAAQWSTPAS